MSDKRCQICKRILDVPGDRASIDCGGDCLACIEAIEADHEVDGQRAFGRECDYDLENGDED